MHIYQHKVQYYETDQMGVTHHSNYIRWMEESRIDFLEQIGWPYQRLEALGISSPVTNVSCKYKLPTFFAEVINITPKVESFNGVTLKIVYQMTNAAGKIVCEAASEHVFLNSKGMFIRLHRDFPELNAKLIELAEA